MGGVIWFSFGITKPEVYKKVFITLFLSKITNFLQDQEIMVDGGGNYEMNLPYKTWKYVSGIKLWSQGIT